MFVTVAERAILHRSTRGQASAARSHHRRDRPNPDALSTRGELLQKHGFHTINDIASVDKQTIAETCEIPESVAERVLNHAKAFQENTAVITDHSRYQKLRSEDLVLLDIETDLQQDRVWCVGVYSYRDDEFQQFVELDDEQKLCENLYEYLVEQDQPPVCYYAGQRFDERLLTESAY